MNSEYKLTNMDGKVLAMGPLDLVLRMLKHSMPDGEYCCSGPDGDEFFYRDDGIVYPAGGVFRNDDGELRRMPPRSLEECKAEFPADLLV